jgi:hypothetical protein
MSACRRPFRVWPAPLLVVSYVLLIGPDRVLAQGTGWEVEVHGGGSSVGNLSGGTATAPAGTALATGDPTNPSRRVSTWFAGDGASLANSVAGQFTGSGAFSARIAPLESFLNRPFAERESGGSFGFRVSRALTERFSAEFNFDYSASALTVPSAIEAGLQNTATTFKGTFEGIMAPLPIIIPTSTLAVSSSSTLRNRSGGSQTIMTGAINVNLLTEGRMIPYATGGIGVISDGGDTPAADMQGQYIFRFQGMTVFDETDTVSLAYDSDDRMVVGVFGGGVRWFLNDRSGIRGDVRVHVGSRTVRTLLDATPTVRTASPDLLLAIWTNTNPSIQFSNNPGLTNLSSSLTGPALNDFQLHEVEGTVTQLLFSAGYFFRF